MGSSRYSKIYYGTDADNQRDTEDNDNKKKTDPTPLETSHSDKENDAGSIQQDNGAGTNPIHTRQCYDQDGKEEIVPLGVMDRCQQADRLDRLVADNTRLRNKVDVLTRRLKHERSQRLSLQEERDRLRDCMHDMAVCMDKWGGSFVEELKKEAGRR